MKKLTIKQRNLDIKVGLFHRKKKRKSSYSPTNYFDSGNWKATNNWIDRQKDTSLKITAGKRNKLTLYLPETMNFYEEYELTVLYISAIRKLTETKELPRKAYKLASVNFDSLKTISTSAALVLTAELSKWDDALRQKLTPNVVNWDPEILKRFTDLGFFELFQNYSIDSELHKPSSTSNVNLVQYIKGRCGDSSKARVLKQGIVDIVGDNVTKWTFLHSGLTEAITNVSHHAYPNKSGFSKIDKNWYMSGSYNKDTKELKIVFYDQGIGIPKSLPASEVWEKTLKYLSKFPPAERKSDEVLLKAAVQLDRTSTGKSDRGKGLQDLLEFIRQRGEGYISILSLKGLYKFSMHNGIETIKSEHFENAVCGTLIIWSVTL